MRRDGHPGVTYKITDPRNACSWIWIVHQQIKDLQKDPASRLSWQPITLSASWKGHVSDISSSPSYCPFRGPAFSPSHTPTCTCPCQYCSSAQCSIIPSFPWSVPPPPPHSSTMGHTDGLCPPPQEPLLITSHCGRQIRRASTETLLRKVFGLWQTLICCVSCYLGAVILYYLVVYTWLLFEYVSGYCFISACSIVIILFWLKVNYLCWVCRG